MLSNTRTHWNNKQVSTLLINCMGFAIFVFSKQTTEIVNYKDNFSAKHI